MNPASRLLLISLAFATLLISGCATSSNPSYMASTQYQTRQVAEGSLFKGDEAVLGSDSIDRILASRVVIPGHARLAVMDLAGASRRSWSPRTFQDEASQRQRLLERLAECGRLGDVGVLPALLTPEKKNVPYLREAAARFQAHLLLVYQSSFNTYTKYRTFAKDEAKAYCTVEVVLLDVRTGIVPFTSVASRDYQVEKQKDDFNLHEATLRAQLNAETEALDQVANDLIAFLESVPE